MGVRNGSLTEGDGKEHLSSSPSSVCRSFWPWFCKICAVGCLNIAGVIDSWRRVATAGRFAVDRTALSSGELDIRNSPKFSEDSCLFLTVYWDGLARKDLNMVSELDCPKRTVITVRPGRDQPLL